MLVPNNATTPLLIKGGNSVAHKTATIAAKYMFLPRNLREQAPPITIVALVETVPAVPAVDTFGQNGTMATDGAADETTWTVPPAWHANAEPFRGVSPARSLSPPAFLAPLPPVAGDRRSTVLAPLDHPWSDAGMVAAARAVLGRTETEPSPLGHAVLTMMAISATDCDEDNGRAAIVVDAWVKLGGLPFAVEVGARLPSVGLMMTLDPVTPSQIVSALRPTPGYSLSSAEVIRNIFRRLREHLAVADQPTYGAAVQRLESCREPEGLPRLVASYLAPTELQWVGEDIALMVESGWAQEDASLLLASVRDAADVATIIDAVGEQAGQVVERHASVLDCIGAFVGPPAAPQLARVYDLKPSRTIMERIATMLAQFPTDDSFQLLIDRLDSELVETVMPDAIRRFPRRAVRMLATI